MIKKGRTCGNRCRTLGGKDLGCIGMILRPYKRIKELEKEKEGLWKDYQYLRLKREESERLRKERQNLHNPTALCEGCVNLIKSSYGYPYACKLDLYENHTRNPMEWLKRNKPHGLLTTLLFVRGCILWTYMQ